MPYITPTATVFKARYPEFDAVSDTRVDVFVGEALHLVDETWVENDYQPAIMALAAHRLVMEGEPALSNGIPFNPSPSQSGNIVRRRVGDVEVELESSSDNVSDRDKRSSFLLDLSKTPYGRRFTQLLRLNTVTWIAV